MQSEAIRTQSGAIARQFTAMRAHPASNGPRSVAREASIAPIAGLSDGLSGDLAGTGGLEFAMLDPEFAMASLFAVMRTVFARRDCQNVHRGTRSRDWGALDDSRRTIYGNRRTIYDDRGTLDDNRRPDFSNRSSLAGDRGPIVGSRGSHDANR